MKKGYLSQYFDGVAIKALRAVEANVNRSNQHEFNGVTGLRAILGQPEEKATYQARFIYLTDNNDEPIVDDSFLTWYDARRPARVERGVMRCEYRLYFPTNQVSQCANEDDLLVIAKRPDNTLLAIIAEAETTIARQITWLFGFAEISHPGFSVREELETEQDKIEFASTLILENIGINIEIYEETFLDGILDKFGSKFPKTREFSEYARSTLPDIKPQENHDASLIAWMEREETLFRTLEKHIIAERLSHGFDGDVDSFIAFSLSVQNRRKSRVGYALENHIQALFTQCGVRYSRGSVTENRSKPDFLFPSNAEYHDSNFDKSRLTMLGVKSSCKER